MTIRRNSGSSVLLAVALLALVVTGCGAGSDSGATGAESSTARVKREPCDYNAPVLDQMPGAPEAWEEGARPAVMLMCSTDQIDLGASIVGYAIPGGGSCVGSYSARLKQAFGELCEPPGSAWLSQCEGPGCVHYFSHTRNSTVLDGPVDKATVGIRILVGHKALEEGVLHADVQGNKFRKIGAEEPFDFFAAYIPRCVEPDRVKVLLIDEHGSIIGTADKWDVAVPSCPRSG